MEGFFYYECPICDYKARRPLPKGDEATTLEIVCRGDAGKVEHTASWRFTRERRSTGNQSTDDAKG